MGLIAKNGTGKSTLLNILAGEEPYDEGKLTFRRDLRVGYLPQLPDLGAAHTVLDACLHGDGGVGGAGALHLWQERQSHSVRDCYLAGYASASF